MMKVNAETVMVLLIERKHFFFTLLDEMEQHHDILSLSFYKQAFFDELVRIDDNNEKNRFQAALQPENLDHAGLLISLDPYADSIKFQSFVIDLFRHFDRSRLRRLSDLELQSLRERVASDLDNLSKYEQQIGSQDWQEAMQVMFDTLHEIHARVRENTLSLNHRANHLAQVVDKNNDISDLDETQRSRQALEEINEIYHRNILPTLQFLNESEPSKNGTALRDIGLLAELFERNRQPQTARQVLTIKNRIRSFANDIHDIRQKMIRYIQQSEESKRQYNAIETWFNRLREETKKRQTGDLRGSRISRQADLFGEFVHFSHFKTRKFDERINWQARARELFDEHLRVNLEKLHTKPNRHPRVEVADNQNILKEQRHQERIKYLMKKVTIRQSQDLQQDLHHYLQQNLADYQLIDLINALAWFTMEQKITPHAIFGQKSIQYQKKILHYHPLTIGYDYD